MKRQNNIIKNVFGFVGVITVFAIHVTTIHAAGIVPCHTEKILGSFAQDPVVLELYNQVEKAQITLSEADIRAAEAAIHKALKENPTSSILQYLLGRTYFVWTIYSIYVKEDKGSGADFLEKTLSVLEDSLNKGVEFSDIYRLAGDSYGWLIDMKAPIIGPLFFGPVYGPKSNRLLARAMKMNDQNPEAHLAVGRNSLYTPALFGGNKKNAVASFQMAIEICPQYYQGHIWLGEASLMLKQKEVAIKAFQKALELAPESAEAKEMLKKVMAGDTVAH